jgi:hypothetical protein
MEWLLDKRNVAEKLNQPRGFRIAFRPADLIHQQDDGEIRP